MDSLKNEKDSLKVENDKPVILPKCKFANSDDTYCCEYCDYNMDEEETFFSHKVLCSLDGKWHKASYVCRNYK